MTDYIEGARYRLVSGTHLRPPGQAGRRQRAVVNTGEVFTPTEAEFDQNTSRLELVETPETYETELSDMTVSEIRALAAEYGVDEDAIEGTGANGQVVKADWVRVIEELEAA